MSEEQAAQNTPLESFFDLVYTLAFTLVTDFVSSHLDWRGVLQGIALLMALWWSWACYSWLTDAISAHRIIKARILILAATAAIAIAALALPEAFGATSLLFAASYFAARLLHVVLYEMASSRQTATHQAILRLAPGFLGGASLLLIASLVEGSARTVLWITALALDYLFPFVRGVGGLQIHANHFAERHGFIIILAIGESIASIGMVHEKITVHVVIAALLAMVLCSALWWTYFDYVKNSAQRRLKEVEDEDRARMARDAYSYIHLAMVGGIVFTALGMKQTIGAPEAPLATIPACSICGGVAVYLLGLYVFRLRVTGTFRIARLVTATLTLTIIPFALVIPSIITVSIIVVLLIGLVTFETLYPDRFRREVVQQNGPSSF